MRRGERTGKSHGSHFCFAGYGRRAAHSPLLSELPLKSPLVICICLIEIPDQSTPSPPLGPQRVAGTSLGNQRLGTSGRGTALIAPNLPRLIHPYSVDRPFFLECCNRGIRVFPELSTLDDPTLSPSSGTQDDSHWQGLGTCPLTLVSPPFYAFLTEQSSSLLRTASLCIQPCTQQALGLCFAFLIHICLMDGMTGNYLPLMKKRESNTALKFFKKNTKLS